MPSFEPLPLSTPRLNLRVPRPDDAQALFAIFSDPQAMRYWATPPWTTLERAHLRIADDLAALQAGEALRLFLEPREGGPIVGAVTLFGFVPGSARAETGYILAPAAWGRGLATEAMGALLDHAFGPLALRRVEADVDPRNTGSCRLLERLGFRQEGHLRERWVVAGEVSDTALFGLLAREWSAMRGEAPWRSN